MESVLEQYGKITVAPRHNSYRLYNPACLGNPTKLALHERDIAFDAANILRANDDLFYLVSNSGNHIGSSYLRNLVAPDNTRVHVLEGLYSYMHLDSTITFLREGLMLLNPERVRNLDRLPEHLQKWDVIWCPEPVDIGHHPGYCNSSPWINMNLLSVNPKLVILEKHQEPLRKKLENYGIECAMLPMRHARTLGGCFHCVTLDLERSQ
jgi:N-dimethylarginine dimethylaminohydrolase